MKINTFLQQNPSFQIYTAGKDIAQIVGSTFEELDLTMGQALILAALVFEPEHKAAFTNLKETFKISKGALSQSLSHLESKGWISRQTDKEDRRISHIRLTNSGKLTTNTLIKKFDQLQSQLESAIGPEELQLFLKGLHRVTKAHSHAEDTIKAQ